MDVGQLVECIVHLVDDHLVLHRNDNLDEHVVAANTPTHTHTQRERERERERENERTNGTHVRRRYASDGRNEVGLPAVPSLGVALDVQLLDAQRDTSSDALAAAGIQECEARVQDAAVAAELLDHGKLALRN